MTKIMRVVITGGDGFLGQGLQALLRTEGHEVSALGRRDANVADASALLAHAAPADALVHLAFPTRAHFRRSYPAEALHETIAGTTNVARLAAACGVNHVVFASSGKVYGSPCRLPTGEDHPRQPGTQLGDLKLLQESLLELSCGRVSGTAGPFAVTALRLFNIYGPGQRGDFLVGHLTRMCRAGGPIPLGEMDHGRDYLHLADACRALYTVLLHPPPRGRFRALNAGSGVATTVREIIALLETMAGRPIDVAIDPSRLRPDEAPEERADTRRLRALGWRQRISLEDGLRSIWAALEPPR